MTASFKIYDGSTFQPINNDYVVSAVLKQANTQNLDKLEISFDRQIENTTYVPSYNKELRLLSDSTPIFGGRINTKSEGAVLGEYTAYSYGQQFLDRRVNEVYENMSPEAIFQDLVSTYTDLTYASTGSTGFIVERLVFRDKTVQEAFKIIADLVDYTYYSDYLKNAYFEPRGTVDTGVTLTVGGNVINIPVWDENPNDLVTKVIVEGGLQDFDNSETFTATASQTVFNLAFEPSGDVLVTVNGTRQKPTVDVSSSGDYTLKGEEKQIIFSSGVTAGHTVVITYTYQLPIRIEQEIDLYDADGNRIIKETKVKNKALRSTQEARRFGRQFLEVNGRIDEETSLNIVGYNTSLTVGNLVTVVDSLNSKNAKYVINSLEYDVVSNITTVKVGVSRYLLWDWQKETMERIRQLEQEDTNYEVLQVYKKVRDDINVSVSSTAIPYTRDIHDSFIFGASKFGTGKFGDRREGDQFTSYDSGSYDVSSYWTGGVTVNQSRLEIPATVSTQYKGREGNATYSLTNGKIVTTVYDGGAGKITQYMRKSSATNYVGVEYDIANDTISLLQNTGSGETVLGTTGNTYSTESKITTRFIGGNIKVYNTNNILFTLSSSVVIGGSVEFLATSAGQSIEAVEIYEG